MESTDEQLADLAKQGDDDAFQILVHRYLPAVFSFARNYARSDEDAEDVAQESFFKAWKHIKRYKSGMRFKPWLYTIVRNTARDVLKKRRAYTFTELDNVNEEITFAETLVDESELPSDLFERSELTSELTQALDTLHPDHRSTLILHYREELTFEEIAETLDRPMNTVKSWHRRAVAKLREHMHQNRP